MKAAAIVALCVLAAVAYGIVHDQVTARVCIEYFTVFHPLIVRSDSPTIQGLVWGVVATWWVGLPLGVGLAFAALGGKRPPCSMRSLLRPIATLLAVMAVGAFVLGCVGYLLGTNGMLQPPRRVAANLHEDRHARFLADLWAHNASYWLGLFGGLVLIGRTWRSRRSIQTSGEVAAG